MAPDPGSDEDCQSRASDKRKLVITAADVAVTPEPAASYTSGTRSAQSSGTGPVTLGDYTILGIAGRGGMGVVYKAEQISLSRTVALKVLKAELTSAGDFRARFLREARLAASVDHPNVVTVYDMGEDNGQLFLVMQWVPGSDLRTILRRDGAMDSYRVFTLVRQIAGALDAVHGAGLLHRDIKPSNVLLRQVGSQDHAYLTDFGVAVAPDSPEQLTGSGAVVGTTGYISPEQIMGQPPDTRSDLYALGCLTFEVLTGGPPFRADNEMGLRWAHVHNARPVASHVLPALGANFDDFFVRALSVEPAERFESGDAFAEAFMDAKRGGGVHVTLKGATAVSPPAQPGPEPSPPAAAPGPTAQALDVSDELVSPPAAAAGPAQPLAVSDELATGVSRAKRPPNALRAHDARVDAQPRRASTARRLAMVPPRVRLLVAAAVVALLVVVAVFLFVVGGGTSATASITRVLTQYQAYLKKGDFAALARILDSGVVRQGPPGSCAVSRGLPAAITSLEAQSRGSGGYQLVDLKPDSIVVHGNSATVRLNFHTATGEAGLVRFDLVDSAGAWTITRIQSNCTQGGLTPAK